jgi:hypothetical protein
MVRILQRRSTRRRLRAIVLVAMVPLAVLNALPLAAGCICADGHYEAICHAGQCQAGTGHCGCSCCAHRSCCCGKTCCHHSATNLREHVPGQHLDESRCCTPLVHQALPTVVNASAVVDSQLVTALVVTPIELPHIEVALRIVQHFDFDTGCPPNDLVITFQRLVI